MQRGSFYLHIWRQLKVSNKPLVWQSLVNLGRTNLKRGNPPAVFRYGPSQIWQYRLEAKRIGLIGTARCLNPRTSTYYQDDSGTENLPLSVPQGLRVQRGNNRRACFVRLQWAYMTKIGMLRRKCLTYCKYYVLLLRQWYSLVILLILWIVYLLIEQIFECAAAYSISLENMNSGIRKLEFKSQSSTTS